MSIKGRREKGKEGSGSYISSKGKQDGKKNKVAKTNEKRKGMSNEN